MKLNAMGQNNGIGGVFGPTFVGQVDCHGVDPVTNTNRGRPPFCIVKQSGNGGSIKEIIAFFMKLEDAQNAANELTAGDVSAQGTYAATGYFAKLNDGRG